MTRDGYLPELPQLPRPFHEYYNGARGIGYCYATSRGSYTLMSFPRPGLRPAYVTTWEESLTYLGPGYRHGSGYGPSLGMIGRWEWDGFFD